jgi:hypothetical protein
MAAFKRHLFRDAAFPVGAEELGGKPEEDDQKASQRHHDQDRNVIRDRHFIYPL